MDSRRHAPMSYQLRELELTQTLNPIEFAPGQTGAALLLRFRGRPIGFLMRKTQGARMWSVQDLSSWIGAELKRKIMEQLICEELASPKESVPLPPVSACVCTRDRVAKLKRCLEALRALQQEHRFEILVIDNAPPSDATAGLVREFPTVRYALEPRLGLDFARNRAWKEASGELVAYLDDDVVVDSSWFAGLEEAWTENPDAAAFTGLVMPLKLDTAAQVFFEERNGFRRGFDKKRFGQTLEGNPLYPCGAGIFGAGCNMAFSREILRQVGGFDEALDTGAPLPGGGDLDMFYRIIRAGYVLVYEPSFMVFHEHRASINALRRQYYTWGLGFMAFVAKSYRTDASQRAKFRGLLRWWIGDQLSQLKRAVRRRQLQGVSLHLAEFYGALVGICGEYSRSVRRIGEVRKNYA